MRSAAVQTERRAEPGDEPAADGAPATTAPAARALLLSELFPPAVGGTPVLFEAIYSRLDAPVTVLTHVLPAAAREDAVRVGMHVVRRPLASARWGMLDPRAALSHLRFAGAARALGSRRDTVVHCARTIPEGVAAWLSRGLGGPPYVCWSHGEDLATARQSREFTALTRRVCHGAAAHIVNSRNTRTMLEAFGVPPARIDVVYPGVDAERFHPGVDGSAIRARAGRDGLLLLSVGRLQRRKGHDLVIRALARLGPDRPARYVIVGDGEERARLEALAVSAGVRDRIEFAGQVPADQLPHYYAACDLFLLPNRVDAGDVEGFGIVFLEAAASRRPVIGGNSGGVPEAIAQDETGLLVSGTDVEELAAAISLLADSPERRHAMGAAGRRRVCAEFTWDRAAAQVSEIHARVAAGRER